jgi:hypothetical protein
MLDLLVIGLISILGQAVVLRELSVAFYGIDLIYVLAMGIWLVFTALGAMIGRKNLAPAGNRIRVSLLAYAILLPADVVFIRSLRTLFSGVPGAYLPFADQVLAMSAALLPVGLLSGWLFQCAVKRAMIGGGSLARAYALESLGGLAGGLLATMGLRIGLQNLSIAVVSAMVSLAAWTFYLGLQRQRRFLHSLCQANRRTDPEGQ